MVPIDGPGRLSFGVRENPSGSPQTARPRRSRRHPRIVMWKSADFWPFRTVRSTMVSMPRHPDLCADHRPLPPREGKDVLTQIKAALRHQSSLRPPAPQRSLEPDSLSRVAQVSQGYFFRDDFPADTTYLCVSSEIPTNPLGYPSPGPTTLCCLARALGHERSRLGLCLSGARGAIW